MTKEQIPSKLNTAVDVPVMPAIASPEVPVVPAPRVPIHATDVAVVQLLVAQSAIASTAVTVASVGPNSMPVSVTLDVADATL